MDGAGGAVESGKKGGCPEEMTGPGTTGRTIFFAFYMYNFLSEILFTF